MNNFIDISFQFTGVIRKNTSKFTSQDAVPNFYQLIMIDSVQTVGCTLFNNILFFSSWNLTGRRKSLVNPNIVRLSVQNQTHHLSPHFRRRSNLIQLGKKCIILWSNPFRSGNITLHYSCPENSLSFPLQANCETATRPIKTPQGSLKTPPPFVSIR